MDFNPKKTLRKARGEFNAILVIYNYHEKLRKKKKFKRKSYRISGKNFPIEFREKNFLLSSHLFPHQNPGFKHSLAKLKWHSKKIFLNALPVCKRNNFHFTIWHLLHMQGKQFWMLTVDLCSLAFSICILYNCYFFEQMMWFCRCMSQ